MRWSALLLVTVLLCAACGPSEPVPDLMIQNVTAERIVDGTGRLLIPGLWDFHVHFTYDDGFTDAMAGLFPAEFFGLEGEMGTVQAVLPR